MQIRGDGAHLLKIRGEGRESDGAHLAQIRDDGRESDGHI